MIAATSGTMPMRNDPSPFSVSICTRSPPRRCRPTARTAGSSTFMSAAAAARSPDRPTIPKVTASVATKTSARYTGQRRGAATSSTPSAKPSAGQI